MQNTKFNHASSKKSVNLKGRGRPTTITTLETVLTRKFKTFTVNDYLLTGFENLHKLHINYNPADIPN